MQRLPRVTSWSSGELTLTIASSWTWSVRLQPTPQYGQTVSTSVCSSSRQSPASLRSNSLFAISAPVGQTATQLPQYTHADSGRGTSSSVEMWEPKPRPATVIANVFCQSEPQASTHL